jgi:hypothetical protein
MIRFLKYKFLLYKRGPPDLQILQIIAFKSVSVTQLCAVSRIREVKLMSAYSVTRMEFAHDTRSHTFASVAQLYAYSDMRYIHPQITNSKTL